MKATHLGRLAVAALALAAASCGSAVREGSGTSFLIVDSLEAASGAEPDEFGNVLYSDVITVVDDVATRFSDLGRVSFTLGLKDPGGPGNATTPTQNQFITIDRYRVRYFRTDGRNTEGSDVPYGFDGAATFTVSASGGAGTFEIVRHLAKREAPLGTLITGSTIISCIAEVTFFGRDQTGREASATARMTIEFGNFGDPD